MKKILVTGSAGFVGKNLLQHLSMVKDVQVLPYDITNTQEELVDYTQQADFVIHLAGVNRPKDVSEFESGNRDLTVKLMELLAQNPKKPTVLLSSSTHAMLETPYGQSKRGAEEAVFEYAQKTGATAYVYRLPNVFGKWCRPQYNSVVATFCNNAANGLEITINDPSVLLTLVYVDDVCAEFVRALSGNANCGADGYYQVPVTHQATVGELGSRILGFAESRKTLIMPDFSDPLTPKLYATFLSYLPENNGFCYPLDKKTDDRGFLAEFIKSKQFGQIFISRTKPGITRGNHWHHTKTEKFLVLTGNAVISFRKIDGDEVIDYHVCGEEPTVLDIPVGYTHKIQNVGQEDVLTLFWSSQIFDPNHPDTIFLEV